MQRPDRAFLSAERQERFLELRQLWRGIRTEVAETERHARSYPYVFSEWAAGLEEEASSLREVVDAYKCDLLDLIAEERSDREQAARVLIAAE